MVIRPTVAASVALVFGLSASGSAQRVRGVVRDSAMGRPIGGAVLWLADSAGHQIVRSIGGGDGSFAIPRLAGAVRLHVIHIGFRPVDVRIGATVADSMVDVQMAAVPVLDVVRISTSRVCPGEDDPVRVSNAPAEMGALELWEQARSALLATIIARESNPARIQLLSFERTMEPVRRATTDQHSEPRFIVGDRPYVAARPAWAFVDEGYMHEDLGGARTFYAPDEEVLLDQRFVETHCLRVVQGETAAHANDIGIGFEPVHNERRDTLVEITGTLWLDRRLAELRTLEFQYTGLERAADRSGGTIVFHTMPTGAAMIQQWVIHATTIAADEPMRPDPVRHRLPDRPDRTNVRILGYQDNGGIVAEVVWPNGTIWHADLPRVTGMVVDPQGEPLVGARVWLVQTPDTATSGEDGMFALPYTLPGRYYVMASDSVLASRGIGRTVPRAVGFFGPFASSNSASGANEAGIGLISAGGDTRIRLQLHPRSEVLPTICPSKSYKPGTGVILGTVMNSLGSPAEGARIDIEVGQTVVAGDSVRRVVKRSANADDDGQFVVCGAVLDQPLRLRATKDNEVAEYVVDRWGDGVLAVTLTLKPR